VKDQVKDKVFCPVVAITADNSLTNCTEKGAPMNDPVACAKRDAETKAMIEIAAEMKSLGDPKLGDVFHCGENMVGDDRICRHDMAWMKIPYLVNIFYLKIKEWKIK
jgi:hypothetical protein